ncbi:putative endonuclease 4 [Bienertia sinuspersici]
MKLLDGETFYFWCSEKSKLLGSDMLLKTSSFIFVVHQMKNLLKGNPTLVELTGISESQLECFENHLHSYLLGPNVRVDGFEVGRNTQSSISLRVLNSLRSALRRKLDDVETSIFLLTAHSWLKQNIAFPSLQVQQHKSLLLAPFSLRITIGSLHAFYHWGHQWRNTQLHFLDPFHYHHSVPFNHLLGVWDLQHGTLDAPTRPDPLPRFPFTKQSSQLPTLTALMCDPIVHKPIDVCSSAQGDLEAVDEGSSNQTMASLMRVFSTVLNKDSQDIVCIMGLAILMQWSTTLQQWDYIQFLINPQELSA